MVDAQAAMGMACNRVEERVAARFGWLNGAESRFETTCDVAQGGVLLALPALLSQGLLKQQEQYFQLPAGFYRPVHIFMLLGFMFLARLKTPEALRYSAPGELGKLLGLDRAPEVKTLRSKLSLLAGDESKVRQWSQALCQDWMESAPELAGWLYVDGHVRVYYGAQVKLPKRYVARQRLCLNGLIDYWVNDQQGQPFFVVEKVVSEGLIKTLQQEIVPRLLKEVPGQPSEEELQADPDRCRFVIIFDREGYSPAFFQELWAQRIAIYSYRKYVTDLWPETEFQTVQVRGFQGEERIMQLAERGTRLGGILWVREIRRLTESGHQTAVIATDFRSPRDRIAVGMFSRWSQENFFKYMMEHFNLNKLVEYQSDVLDETVEVVNPAYRQLQGEIKSKAAKLSRQEAKFGALALEAELSAEAVQDYQQQKGELLGEIERLKRDVTQLKEQRQQVPPRLAIQDLPATERLGKLAQSRKHLLDTIKMIAYRAETALANILRPLMAHQEEARSLLRQVFTTEADLLPDQQKGRLTVAIHPMANARSSDLVEALCHQLNETEILFPGTDLRLHYRVLSTGPPQVLNPPEC